MKNLILFHPLRRLSLLFLVVVAFYSCTVSQKYAKEARAKWQNEIGEFKKQDKAHPDPQGAVLFTGSSSIRLWSTLEADVKPYPVIQRGFGGSKFSDLAVYTKDIVYPHQFMALVIFEANDITGDKTDKTPKEVARLFENIVQVVRKKYTRKPVFVIAITPTSSRWKVWPQIQEANRLLKESCRKLPNTYFVDTVPYYLNQDGKPRDELFGKDLLHQNGEGYRIWGTLIRKRLDEVLKQ